MTIIVEHIPPARWYQRARWKVVEPCRVSGYAIPAGFISDGGSVPLWLTWLVSPVGKAFPAAVLHDYLLGIMVRAAADRAFLHAMRACGVAGWRAWMMYFAVRVHGRAKQWMILLTGDVFRESRRKENGK